MSSTSKTPADIATETEVEEKTTTTVTIPKISVSKRELIFTAAGMLLGAVATVLVYRRQAEEEYEELSA